MLTPEQQAVRSQGIGGSEIGAVAGLNPWASPHTIFERKLGLARFEPTNASDWGTYMEPAIIKLWRKQQERRGTPKRVRYAGRHQRTIKHPQHPIVLNTADGIVEPDRALLEVKTYGYHVSHHWGEPGTDAIPEYHLAQVTWGMACLGLTHAIVLAQHDREIDEYRVPYSADLFEALRETAERFWVDHILTRTPPPPDHSQRCREFLSRYYPKFLEPKTLVPTTDAVDQWAVRLRDAEAMLKEAEKRKREAGNNLCSYIGSAYGVQTSIGKVLWYNSRSATTYKGKALYKLAQELGAKKEQLAGLMTEPTQFRVLRGYWPKEN